MKEITRHLKATKDADYIIPAITLGDNKAFHIGIDKGDGEVACLCGQHHKQNDDVWNSPSVEEAPYITCGSCLRSMKAIIRYTDMRPFFAIMHAVGQKISTAAFHVKQERVNTTTSNRHYEIEEEPRIMSYPRMTPIGVILTACKQSAWSTTPGSIESQLVHSAYITFNTPVISSVHTICEEEGHWDIIPQPEYATYPNITCPKCAAIQHARKVGHEPKRDKSIQQRINMITCGLDYIKVVRKRLSPNHVDYSESLKAVQLEETNLHNMLKGFVVVPKPLIC